MDLATEIRSWLHTRGTWLQEAADRLLKIGALSESDIADLVTLCKTDEGQKPSTTRQFAELAGISSSVGDLRLLSIGPISGIDALAPRNPLSFEKSNLAVVFGSNGSGKSGYIRILKKICGKPTARDLRPNVYKAPPADQSCTVRYRFADEETTTKWISNSAPLAELQSIDIFDGNSGLVYITNESSPTYTPPLLNLFDQLVKASASVRRIIEAEKFALRSHLPSMPGEYAETKTGKAYRGLKASDQIGDLDALINWSDADTRMQNLLHERLRQEDPGKLAKVQRAQEAQRRILIQLTETALSAFSQVQGELLIGKKKNAKDKRRIAVESAKASFAKAELTGVGTDTWKAMWDAARKYSSSEPYKSISFPVTAVGARCVLCQQELSDIARQRLLDFEAYVVGTLEQAATRAEREWSEAANRLPAILASDDIAVRLGAANLETAVWQQLIQATWEAFARAREQLLDPAVLEAPSNITREIAPWLDQLGSEAGALKFSANQLELDAAGFNRVEAKSTLTELTARHWTSKQKSAIQAEIGRLQQIDQFDRWIASTNTQPISIKAGSISEHLVTETYISRFNHELKLLGASGIQVEMHKTRIAHGKPMLGIKLRNLSSPDAPPQDILSDGERRIVELAAFLADVSLKTSEAPFIFDDPVTSLDQEYEERIARRLIALSEHHQIIVFTHRLSLLGLLSENSEMVCVRGEIWGTGEPGDTPLFSKKPEASLNVLKNDRLARAKKVLTEQGHEAYYPLAKSVCSDFRILLERIVEFKLLGNIVLRHRRDIQTKGKIHNLSKIKTEDCSVIDEYMTKYSAYEHSQSLELPTSIPSPDELGADIDSVLSWLADFDKRMK